MPIFQDPERVISSLGAAPPESPASDNDHHRNPSWSQQWADDELVDIEMAGTSPINCQPDHYDHRNGRDEYIQSLKRRQAPRWKSLFSLEKQPYLDHHPKPFGIQHDTAYSPPRVAVQDMSRVEERQVAGPLPVIERPRSALHSGDFTEGQQNRTPEHPEHPGHQRFNNIQYEHAVGHRFSTSPTTPWYFQSFSAHPLVKDPETSPLAGRASIQGSRSRAPSLGSFSSSYILKAPTSPLVHQANNADLDFSPKAESSELSTFEKRNRRRTLPPETFGQFRGSPPAHSRNAGFGKSFASLQREESLPSQAHQPRRSSAYSLQLASSPHTQFRPRRPSLASDLSPCIHASMVGSYEESILRGRMSTSPSKPLDFTAQIGVMGKGKCKSNLKCPPHIAVPFPAVFYSYPTSGAGRSISDDNPSPYVGLIDLDNSISQSTAHQERKKRSYEHLPTESKDSHALTASPSNNESSQPRNKREKRVGRPEGLKTPPGGSYRIPQRGQLQIVIKNPNKTAVKLFLVPYDLDGMEPGTKTFIRQRSYSAGPIIDMPLTARKNFGTDRPEASLNSTGDPKDKPTLRYLIHLNICCTSRGRFYLYSTIRVVFANRVPDGKEKLRNEIQYPEPRYSPYRPVKDSAHANSRTPTENSFRRRSAVAGPTASQFHDNDYHHNNHHPHLHTTSPYPKHSPPASPPSKIASTLPFKLSTPKPRRDAPVIQHDAGSSSTTTFGSPWQPTPPPNTNENDDDDNPFHHQKNNTATTPPHSPKSLQHDNSHNKSNTSVHNNNDNDLYNKLQKGDAGYGGGYRFFGSLAESSSESGESLLAQKLKDWTCKK
ncbi:Protein FAM214A [Talaromyces islandicus]|uniref:Protein FAM214A n=1 Tax=Talaromyces islandicus TaxID=28573 RepID=A0A0U1M2U7_TALIS|nr:Protein FAM214A [Talaromyces islandicus]